ncbi:MULTISPECIES: transcriptional regulator GcvA [unclassified Azospirillum]|uniref:transcriptional regulator GcvA n=1 Tax=unclassified Azospirillum TaxID=2630922 RepID=UPI000B6CB854|nr:MULTISPECIES: transcriptional regulator GcvA [unclassified Azospirillum]SNR89855.1 transcriptional regulator [Azospirillum sp. RU38E]SNS06000.1 transcriptional regulator [Azospirillum sp. RU37A]
MSDHRLPPLNALRAFASAARYLSFTKAADELAVTQAAISYQVRQLEEHIGRELFRRLTRRLELTPAGLELQAAVDDAFDRIRSTVARLTEATENKVLAVTCMFTFATQWLVPRLGHFQLLRPDLAVRLDSSVRVGDLETEFDIAIRAGSGRWPGVRAEWLMDFTLTPAVSPQMLERAGGVREPADLLRLPLLDCQHPEDILWWRQWFALAGVKVDKLPGGPQFDVHGVTAQAAAMGQGVALVCPALFGADIAAGRLVLPFPDIMYRTDRFYWLACSERRADEPKIRAFRDWIFSEINACAGQCGLPLGPLPLARAPQAG